MSRSLVEDVIKSGSCTGCGACVALVESRGAYMEDTPLGPVPHLPEDVIFPNFLERICPGRGIDYPVLYREHYEQYPQSWLTGHSIKVRTGFAADEIIRQHGASGGILTQTLIYLLESGRVDGVIVARQGVPTAKKARAVIAQTREEVIAAAQSVYIPVAMLDMLRELDQGKAYAITCLPEQSAALRRLQLEGFAPAQQIKYVLGPYTGTALYPAAIDCYLQSKRVPDTDRVTSLKWRAGEWPGYLEICTESGRVIQTPKIYYNFLIPFFVTQTSLQSMDFANEFSDLAVGDAWSPVFEAQGGGHSVVVTRSKKMEAIIQEMIQAGLLDLQEIDALKAADMHGHMLDFKKRGGYLRNRWRSLTGRMAPDYGYRPAQIPFSRICVEIVISTLFAVGRTRLARFCVARLPESIIGPLFNFLRLSWKTASKPTKRKGLKGFDVVIKP